LGSWGGVWVGFGGPAGGGLLGNTTWGRFWRTVLSLEIFCMIVCLPESLQKENGKSAWHMANPLGSLTL